MTSKRYAAPIRLTLLASVLWFVPALAQEGPLLLRPGAPESAPAAPAKPATRSVTTPATRPASAPKASSTQPVRGPSAQNSNSKKGGDGAAETNIPASPPAAPAKAETAKPAVAKPATAKPAMSQPAPAVKPAPSAKPAPTARRGGKGAPAVVQPVTPELTELSGNMLGRQSYGWVAPGRLDDHSLATDTRLLTNRVVTVLPVELVGQPRAALTETLPPPPRPIYTILGWTPPSVPIHEPGMIAFDSTEAAPLALNSLESFEAGLPAGPYRAGLIEDQDKNPERPRIELGTVMWRVVPGTGGDGVDSVAALRADIVITKMKLRAEVTIRPNRDPKVATPLVMDVIFTGTENTITQIGMPELRSLGVDRGIPLYGTIQPKGDGFAVLLASAQNDGEQNVRLLSSRSWIDIPVRFKNGSRMILAFEKGTAVRDMLRGTFRAWRLPWLP